MDEVACGHAIFGGLALAALAHEVTTSGCAPAKGNTTALVRVDLLARAMPKKWTPQVRLPVDTQQSALPSFLVQLGHKEDEGNPQVALLEYKEQATPVQCPP